MSLSKYSLRNIAVNKLNSVDLDNKVLLFTGDLDNKSEEFEFNQIYPYSFLSERLRNKSYTELLNDGHLHDDLLTDKEVYKIGSIEGFDPKLREELLNYFRSAVGDIEVRYLHFQGLLKSIEDEYDKYEEFEF